jgi:hypothetical protein
MGEHLLLLGIPLRAVSASFRDIILRERPGRCRHWYSSQFHSTDVPGRGAVHSIKSTFEVAISPQTRYCSLEHDAQ